MGSVVQVIHSPFCKQEALSSNPNPTKDKKKDYELLITGGHETMQDKYHGFLRESTNLMGILGLDP
jgi:hypothetical protein